jgi:asparagine synthase (glutamine-hydrolysing)
VCGIAGTIGIDPGKAVPAAAQMLSALRHRGPDGKGTELIEGPGHPVVFAHARLAIIDLSPAGRQPMSCQRAGTADRTWMTYNGEVYNFRDLRESLGPHGLAPASGSDTEVMMLAYRLWGEAAVERFRGMFAFALADPEGGRVWLARDRLGIKPLYFFRPPSGGLLFASEVRALLAAGPNLVPRRLSTRAAESFLAQGAVFGSDSHVEGITQLGPGESLSIGWDGAEISRRRYWSIPFLPVSDEIRKNAVCRLADISRTAVRQHLIADVPVGVFLSSGIDSTTVATLATEVAAGQVRTISVGFDRPDFDETADAALLAKQLGTDHHAIRVSSADIRNDFDCVLAATDQPTVDGFNTYYVSRAARAAGVTVALSGLGGDELFGGYASFRDVPRARRWLKLMRPRCLAAPLIRRLGRALGSRGLLKVSEAALRPPTLADLYLLRRELFLPSERRELFALPEGCDSLSGLQAGDLDDLRKLIENLDSQNAISALELTAYMRFMLLRDSDVFSMAHGLELRVPLLDHELVAATVNLPGSWKRTAASPKPLLVDAVGSRLPKRVTTLPKRGFTFPWADWFRKDLAPVALDRLSDRSIWQNVGFDPSVPMALWERFQRKDPAIGGLHILGLIVLADVAARQGLSV